MTRRALVAALLYTFVPLAAGAQTAPRPLAHSSPVHTLGQAPFKIVTPTAHTSSTSVVRPFLATPTLSVDTSIRRASRNFYNAIYGVSDGIPEDWTGDVATGVAGDTSQDFKDAVTLRVNLFRAFAGVPALITLNSTWNGEAQQAALMMSANNQLNHHPPTTWTDYTAQGAQAASSSDLSLGDDGPDAITGYIQDPGSNNAEAGHRRWILYPPTEQMGTGDIPRSANFSAANDLWVFDTTHAYPSVRDGFVAWPPKGYVPYQLVYPRWSFSLANANFSAATVTVSRSGTNVGTVIVSSTDNGYGDNTLVWTLSGTPDGSAAMTAPASDTTYSVTVANVIVGGVAHGYTYSVIVFDPAVTGPDDILPTFTAPSNIAAGASTDLSFTTLPEASRYDVWSATLQTAAWVEGAETTPFHLTAETTGTYSFINSTTAATGSKCFQLCQDNFNNQDLLLNSSFVASASSSISFASRYGYMTPTQFARVQVSLDDGASWTSVFSRAGTSSDSGSFSPQTVSLAAYANRIIRIRFLLDYTGGSAYVETGDNAVGWLIDDITPNNLAEASSITETSLAAGPYTFTAPSQASTTSLAVRAVLFDNFPLEYGPVATITVSQDSTFPAITSSTTATASVGNAFSGYTVTTTSTGSPTTFAASGLPPGLSIDSSTGIISGTPTQAGVYPVALMATNPTTSEVGNATLTFTITKGTATVTFGNLTTSYSGAPQSAPATTNPNGLALTMTYNGSATAPTAVGTYTVVATVSDANYTGTATGTFAITKAAAGITLGNLTATYTGTGQAATVTTSPAGLPVTLTYNGKSTLPVSAGNYAVTATVNSANASGSTTGTLVISPANATVTLGSLAAVYNGKPHAATATTVPAKMVVTFTYNGIATPPNLVGNYAVVGTIANANYAGSTNSTLVISPISPQATTAAATSVGANTATLNSLINPSGAITSVSYQYGTTSSYGTTAGGQNIAAGSATVASPKTIGGLSPQTLYHFRVVATNAAGTINGADKTFTTLAQPIFGSFPVTPFLSASGSQVGFGVNPGGVATSVYFEFGTTTGYGSQTATQSIGSGRTAITVNGFLPGLAPNTLYHYRVVTVSAAGTFDGPDETFTTLGFDTTLIVAKGDASGIANVSFGVLGNPAVNEHDAVAEKTTLAGTGITAANNVAIFADDSGGTPHLIAQTGVAGTAPLATGSGTFFSLGDPVYNNNEAVAFSAELNALTGVVTKANEFGVWSTSSGPLALVARQGSQAPGCAAGVTFSAFNAVGLSDADTILQATLTNSVALGVTSLTNFGIWEGTTANDLTLILRTGDSVGGKTINKLSLFSTQALVGGQTRNFASNTGDLVTGAAFTDKTTGIVEVVSGTSELVAVTGDAATGIPSATFATFGSPIINTHDHVAFAAKLALITGSITATNNAGIWADDSNGTRQLIAHSGPVANSNATILTLGDPVSNNNDAVAFLMTSRVGATNTPLLTDIMCNSSGTLASVARLGTQAAGCPAGANFTAFEALALPDSGGVVFLGTLAANKAAGITAANNVGIWAVDNTGTLQLIVRTGDVLNGKTVTALTFLSPLNNQSRSFAQENGDLVYLATFSDKSTAIFNVVFP